MADISLYADAHIGFDGSSFPIEYGVTIEEVSWLGDGTIKQLVLFINKDRIRIWPIDPSRIEQLGQKLIKIALELHLEQSQQNQTRRER